MKKTHYPVENGEMGINGCKMTWSMKRSRGGSAFGIRGSRIFWLELKKNDETVGLYDYGWSKKVADEDDESAICLNYLIDRYGKETPKKKREMGSPV